MTHHPVHVAIAILYQNDRFLLQLRDDIPGIRYPGCWALFGGHIEPGETPEVALKRELEEEISYSPPQVSEFCCYEDGEVVRHVFQAQLAVKVKDLVLKEGWDMKLLTATEIELGHCYSEKAGMVRSLGHPHQQILLDFIRKKTRN